MSEEEPTGYLASGLTWEEYQVLDSTPPIALWDIGIGPPDDGWCPECGRSDFYWWYELWGHLKTEHPVEFLEYFMRTQLGVRDD